MTGDKEKYQYSGLKWLYEMELLDDPQLINNMKLNIMDASDFRVKEVEFVMAQSQQKALIWIKVGWITKVFKLRRTCGAIHERLSQLLPTYQFRIVTDRSILELAITKLKKSLVGGTYAVSTSVDDSDSDSDTDEGARPESGLPKTPNILPDKEEQTQDKQSKSVSAVKSDTPSVKKVQDPG